MDIKAVCKSPLGEFALLGPLLPGPWATHINSGGWVALCGLLESIGKPELLPARFEPDVDMGTVTKRLLLRGPASAERDAIADFIKRPVG